MLNAAEVEKGTLASNAMMEYNLDTPGWVAVSMIDPAGMNGDGSLAVVSSEVLGELEEAVPNYQHKWHLSRIVISPQYGAQSL